MASHICDHCGGLKADGNPITVGRMVVLAPTHCRMLVDDVVIFLSDTEARLIYTLAEHAPALVDKADLFDLVWAGPAKPATRKIIDIIVHNLRDKLDVAVSNGRRLIVTEYGKGVGLSNGA